jgi:alkylhydroperoxidase family enzyme
MAEPIDDLRAVVAATPAPPPVMAAYLSKVAEAAYAITDEDVKALTTAGLSDDEIFEQTVAAAIAQGLRRLDAAATVIG